MGQFHLILGLWHVPAKSVLRDDWDCHKSRAAAAHFGLAEGCRGPCAQGGGRWIRLVEPR